MRTTLKDHEDAVASVVIPPDLDTPEFREAWQLWNEHRKEIRAYQTKQAIKLQLKKLRTWGVKRSIAAIEYSAEHAWTGIYEPRAGNITVRLDGNMRF